MVWRILAASAALWLAGCAVPGADGTVLLIAMSVVGDGAPLAEVDVLRVTTTYDQVHAKIVQLPSPAPLRFGLRTPPGYQGPVTVSVQRTDAQGCSTASGSGRAQINLEDSIEVPLTLRTTPPCDDPVPSPKNALPDLIVGELPDDVRGLFSGSGSGPAPALLYPYDNTLTAPQINRMRVQWTGAHATYKVLITGPVVSQRAFVACQSGTPCSLELSDALWTKLANNNRDQELIITVTGAASKNVAQGASAPTRVRIAPSDLRGGIYYFSPTTKGLKRVPLGARQPTDFLAAGGGSGCAGCHALSRDGRKLAIELGSADTTLGSMVVNAADPTQRSFPASRDIAWNFAWFNPEGDRLISAWQGALSLRDASTGQKIADIPPALLGGAGATMPEWSPDGKWIAFVRMLRVSRDYALSDGGDIVIAPYDKGAVGAPVTLVVGQPGKEVHAWPSWSPDSRWLVFNSQSCPGRVCQSYDAQATRLRLVRAIGDDGQPTAPTDPAPAGATLPRPLELLAGTHAPDQFNNWPKFAPFLQAGKDGRQLAFVLFNSRAGFGHQAGGTPQLYLFAVDLAAAALGGDPSFAPLWLPFQDASTANHSALWTTDVACQQASDCPSEFGCAGGSCVPTLG